MTALDALLFHPQDLLRADAFPHSIDRLSLRETHISWVILTGAFAYKVKKPVKFEFIDASTLERRRQLCEEELRLNRRFAPELYINVQPIVLRDGKLAVGGDGPVVDYAVRMQQFSEADELLSLLRSDSVTSQEIATLAGLIADFHAHAHVIRPATVDSKTQPLAETVLDNTVELRSHLERADINMPIGDIVEWTEASVRELATQLRLRLQSGRIRECHGDLHAGNIVRFQGRLIPFDCIEFNAELRDIDVIDDIAFLFMDLISHGREDLAFVLINAYWERTGDYTAATLLRFYAVYRALVRAKVDVLSLEQASANAGGTARLHDRIHTARQLTKLNSKPILILMHGVSGSGKSWLSERLAARIPAMRVRSDVERKRLAKSQAEPPDAGTLYSAEYNRLTYQRIAECAAACLAAGFNCIADATFLSRDDREPFHALAMGLGVPHVILSCEAPYSVMAQRIVQRGAAQRDASDADLTVLRHQLDSRQPFDVSERQFVLSLDTSDANIADSALGEIRVRMR